MFRNLKNQGCAIDTKYVLGYLEIVRRLFHLLTNKNASAIPRQSMAKIKEKVLLITGSNSHEYDRPCKRLSRENTCNKTRKITRRPVYLLT